MDHELFELGDVQTDGGEILRSARLAYATSGTLNATADNCILIPSYYTGTHHSYEAMVGPGRAFDPDRWFIVRTNLFGNGLSSSPSNTDGPFPHLTIADNVRCQHDLLFAHLGVKRLALVCGWSMGAIQSYAWASLYPDLVDRLLPWCGSAQCWPLNRVFLEGLARTLGADPRPGKPEGLRAFGRSYASWAYSAAFYREERWRALGHDTLESFLVYWEDDHAAWDYRDLLTMLQTWRTAAPATSDGRSDLGAFLGRIKARTLVMPCDRDAYFTLEECELEANLIKDCRMEVIHSPFGHCAGAPGREPGATAQISAAILRLLRD